MSEADKVLIEAELAAVDAKAAVLRRALGETIAPPPARKRRGPRTQHVEPPTADELADVTDLDRARVEIAARRAGHQ